MITSLLAKMKCLNLSRALPLSLKIGTLPTIMVFTFVCGLPYSGKSTFCRSLPPEYQHLEMDAAHNAFVQDKGRVYELMKKFDPHLAKQADLYGKMLGLTTSAEKARLIFMQLQRQSNDSEAEFLDIKYQIAYLFNQCEGIPVLDGTFINRISRQVGLEAATLLLPDLKHESKQIIYFAPGFLTCLKRSFQKREHYSSISKSGFFQLVQWARQEELPQQGE